ncbi:mannose-1-phosphate guanylyltransferase (GDP) /mannose-6-phosphate isomerase type 2 [Rhizobium subbaraonis]|uniref:mannose-1-phosphate guanylyltransferase n=1 Tax=Rhizobium subbaraonis TaxID=908946 RepID=A0A285UTD3_9HYPH|nr:mannose-1-phosphate guanylyltransferase/mannose-6-phosphate isomerase [Rhizobium subbaraonis]SOC43501.1 mannose-1-phosphate guanylyltransferase (GDP) /mannose-6-phosphate isomerase type 2 [Rhizobium subbaraonis]
MSEKIIPVIMAGGKGTRLWPLSRSSAPKQFMSLLGKNTLFQRTLARVADTERYEAPIVLTNAEFRFLVAEQARQIDQPLSKILLEPVARNTAPALAAAALIVAGEFGERAIMQVLASDHEIVEDDVYRDCVARAAEAAQAGRLVTFGITPTEPATGYGYIEAGEELGGGACAVKRFIEKPDRERAEQLVAAGGYLWNSGMFMLPVGIFLQELRQLAPEVLEAATQAIAGAKADLDFVRLEEEAFSKAPDISIDYAIFEKTPIAAVVPSPIEWSDLGSWDSVWKLGEQDGSGNVADGRTTLLDTHNSLVLSKDIHVAVQGMSDIAVIASEDAVYIGRMEDSQNVGKLVKHLASMRETAPLTETHRTSYRPWGGYTSVLNGDRFQVKRLFVKPGRRLSLQKHHHRSEHWIVVRGTAEVTVGEKVIPLRENESVYIPQGELHRLANPGKILLELIEVQTGSYLGEDDIIRIEDEFGRD